MHMPVDKELKRLRKIQALIDDIVMVSQSIDVQEIPIEQLCLAYAPKKRTVLLLFRDTGILVYLIELECLALGLKVTTEFLEDTIRECV